MHLERSLSYPWVKWILSKFDLTHILEPTFACMIYFSTSKFCPLQLLCILSSEIFKQCYAAAKPVILEPVMLVELKVPMEFQGTVAGDINKWVFSYFTEILDLFFFSFLFCFLVNQNIWVNPTIFYWKCYCSHLIGGKVLLLEMTRREMTLLLLPM